MIYRKPANDKNSARVKSYRGTVKTLADDSLLALKENIRTINAEARIRNKEIVARAQMNNGLVQAYDRDTNSTRWVELSAQHLRPTYRVRTMGRGPREAVVAAARSKGYICDLAVYLPQEFATHFDVYVQKNYAELEKVAHNA